MFQTQISNLSNFQGIELESDISIITLNDNIVHTYCSKIKWEKDNFTPIGIATLIMPYSNQVAQYWMKYSGAVVIHANLNSVSQPINQAFAQNLPNSQSLNFKNFQKDLEEAEKTQQREHKKEKKTNVKKDKHKNQLHIKNDFYNYSYIGKVSRFKQVGKTFIVYLEDIGWKFMQKVPKEFRDTFIAGQTLDNAFQAICEFMGVEFAYSIEDLSQYSFSADGYSIQKGNEIIEDVPSILKEWGNPEKEDDEEMTEDERMAKELENGQQSELSGLRDYLEQKSTQEEQKNNNNNNPLNTQGTNNTPNSNNALDNTQDTSTTPTEKIEQYQEEFDDKIKNLFIGNTLYDSNISDPILNYDWITITPQAAASATTTSTTNPNQNTNNSNDPNSQNNNSNSNTNEQNNNGQNLGVN